MLAKCPSPTPPFLLYLFGYCLFMGVQKCNIIICAQQRTFFPPYYWVVQSIFYCVLRLCFCGVCWGAGVSIYIDSAQRCLAGRGRRRDSESCAHCSMETGVCLDRYAEQRSCRPDQSSLAKQQFSHFHLPQSMSLSLTFDLFHKCRSEPGVSCQSKKKEGSVWAHVWNPRQGRTTVAMLTD